jgi:hypothetical protein
MKKISLFLIIFLSLTISTKSYSRDVSNVIWINGSANAYNECMFLLSFICTITQDVKTNKNVGSINSYITIFDKNNKEIKTFKIKKIEYKNGKCWLTPQPIRKYTTYFVATKCFQR